MCGGDIMYAFSLALARHVKTVYVKCSTFFLLALKKIIHIAFFATLLCEIQWGLAFCILKNLVEGEMRWRFLFLYFLNTSAVRVLPSA